MPLPVQPAADSMPSGDSSDPNAVLASAVTPNGGTQPTAGAGASGWMPVFQIGSGQTGVPTDARGLISGFQASGTVGSQVSSSAGTALQNAQSALGTGGGDTTSSGSATGSTAPSGGAASSQPAPKATSKAQRDANNAEAQREFPGYVGADG